MPYLKRLAPYPEPTDCKILTAALNLFVERGYHKVSIHHIQKQADVSIGSIYRHFNGKEGVASALYNHILNEVDELIDGVTSKIHTPIDQLEEIIKQFFEHTETHHQIISFIFHAKHSDFLTDEPPLCDALPFKKMRDITSKAIQNGDLEEQDKWIATSIIFGGTTRLIQLRLDGVIKKPLTDSLDTYLNSLWGGLRSNQTDYIEEKSRIAS